MAVLKGSTFIDAQIEHIFNVLAEPPDRMNASWNNPVQLMDFERLPGGGYRFQWVYQWLDFEVEGLSQTVEFVPNKRIVVKSTGPIEATAIWTLDPDPSGVRVALCVEYRVCTGPLPQLSQHFIANQIRYEIALSLSELRTLVRQNGRSGHQEQAGPPRIGMPVAMRCVPRLSPTILPLVSLRQVS